MKPFRFQPLDLQHTFEDEYAHLVWSANLGLVDNSAVAVPLYTLTNKGGWCKMLENRRQLGGGNTKGGINWRMKQGTASRRSNWMCFTRRGKRIAVSTQRRDRQGHQREVNAKWSLAEAL